MTKRVANREKDAKRLTLRLAPGTVRRIEEFAGRSGVSVSRCVDMLCNSGLDAEVAGIENLLSMEQKIVTEMRSLRGLVVAAIDSGDAAVAAVLAHQVAAELLEPDGISHQYITIRRALPKFKALKKQVSASASDDMMSGTVEG